MADTLKEFGMKVFSDTELANATRFDITTGGTEAAVIKDIELTQNSSTQAVSGTVTAGTTTNLGNGIHSEIGTFGAGVTNLTGSAILDVSSTLSIRPTAISNSFSDLKIYAEDSSGSTSATGPVNLFTTPRVNGLDEPTTQTALTASSPGSSSASYQGYSGEFTVIHTNANGIKLLMRFISGSSSNSSVYIVGADNSQNYATVQSNSTRVCWDGERYLFWMSDGYIYFFDLDDSNILNPSTHGTTCHGRMTCGSVVNSPLAAFNGTSYLHKAGDVKRSFVDGKRYFYQFVQIYGVFAQLPDTIADNVVVPRFWLSGNGNSQGSINPSGLGHANNSHYNERYAYNQNNFGGGQGWTQIWIKKDETNGHRWFISHKSSSDEALIWTWLDSDMKNLTTNGTVLGTNDSSGGNHVTYGLSSIAYQDLSKPQLGWEASNFDNPGYGGRLRWDSSYAGGNMPSTFQNGSNNHYFFDGSTGKDVFYIANWSSSSKGVYKLDLSTAAGQLVVGSADHAAYRGNYFISFSTPSQSVINSRTYTLKPGLKVRVTGIREDRS